MKIKKIKSSFTEQEIDLKLATMKHAEETKMNKFHNKWVRQQCDPFIKEFQACAHIYGFKVVMECREKFKKKMDDCAFEINTPENKRLSYIRYLEQQKEKEIKKKLKTQQFKKKEGNITNNK